MVLPNVDAGADEVSKSLRRYRESGANRRIRFFKNMEPEDFLVLLLNSKCLVGNSSVGIRECAFLGVPVVNIGIRQHRRLRGRNVIDVDHDKLQIINAIKTHLSNRNRPSSSAIYGAGNAGELIAECLAKVELTFNKTITY